jgi:hypothetical protein
MWITVFNVSTRSCCSKTFGIHENRIFLFGGKQQKSMHHVKHYQMHQKNHKLRRPWRLTSLRTDTCDLRMLRFHITKMFSIRSSSGRSRSRGTGEGSKPQGSSHSLSDSIAAATSLAPIAQSLASSRVPACGTAPSPNRIHLPHMRRITFTLPD